MASVPNKKMRGRAVFIAAILTLLGFGLVIFQLYRVQLVEGEAYKQEAMSRQLRATTISANRGAIYSSDGQVLAASATSWRVVFSPADITAEEAELLADGMSEILGTDRAFILERAQNKKSFYQVIKTRVDKESADAAYQFALDNKIDGVTLLPDSTRYYPYGTMASTVLGFVNADNEGAYGLEAYYNSTLSGTPGKIVTAKNAWGTDMPYTYQDITSAEDGNSLVLTMDSNIQSVIEKHLATALTEHAVQNRATVIVQDVTTGAILGMTTMPDYDPNNPQAIVSEISLQKLAQYEKGSDEYKKAFAHEQQVQWSNKAVNEAYEPGSVFKVITTATALETGAVTMNSGFNCTGSYVVGGITKHCWKHAGHGAQTLAQAIQNSCNPAYMQIGQRIGGTDFYNFFRAFGLTDPTGIDLPGEESGYFYSEAQLNSTQGNLETAAFGQSFKVTPIQLITAISAAVNGGYLYEPYVVDKILDCEGNVVSVTEPTVRRQVISEETSRQVCKLMEGVVTAGSGKNAAVPGYSIGGKTGTSEKLDSDRGYYTYSFAGVAPMDDPKVAVLLILDEPYETDLYGSTVAAPVVGAILSEILPYLGVETNFTAAERAAINAEVPNAVGQSAHMGMAAMTQKQLSAVIVGGGDTVIAQVPEAGAVIRKGSTVILYTDQESQEQKVKVPDVRGKTGQVVNTILVNAGLNLDAEGIGKISDTAVAVEQSIEPGTEVPRGTLITVKFSNSVKQEASP